MNVNEMLSKEYLKNISFDTLKKISECKVLKKEGIIISEHGNYENPCFYPLLQSVSNE